MTEKLSTGIEVLDRKLDGGVPAGTVTVLSAPPVSQSELFLYELASVRETLYLTTERPASAVEAVLESTGAPIDRVRVVHVAGDDPLEQASEAVADLPERTNVIVDPTRRLERGSEGEYRAFLSALAESVAAANATAVLHCLDGRGVSPRRDVTEYLADLVFELATEQAGESIENQLAVPKFRGGTALEEVIKLNLASGVTIDVSRKIA
ncbi:MAG: RAD55 family ATPase [Halosimplex sp.]